MQLTEAICYYLDVLDIYSAMIVQSLNQNFTRRSINYWTINLEGNRDRSSLSKFNKETYAMQEQGTL